MYDPETGSIREPVTILGVLPNQGHVEVRHSDGSISVYTGFDPLSDSSSRRDPSA